jgi:hypothetical protein
MTTTTSERRAMAPAKDWEKIFLAADVRVEELNACKSAHAKAIWIGKYLSPLVGKEVAIAVKGRTGRAVLRVEPGRAKEKLYYFEIAWDEPATTEPAVPKGGKAPKAKKEKAKTAARGKKPKEKPTKGSPGSAQQTDKKPATAKGAAATKAGATKAKGKPRSQCGGNDLDW